MSLNLGLGLTSRYFASGSGGGPGPVGPFDLSTKTLNGSYAMSGVTNAQAVRFSEDGTKFYVVDSIASTSVTIKQFDMSVAWDVTTATAGTTFNVMPQAGASATGLAFKADGSKMYVVGASGVTYQYSLSTPWTLSTAVYDSKSFTGPTARGIDFKDDGTKAYRQTSNTVTTRYSLSTAWDISTASADSNTVTTTTEDTAALDIFFRKDGTQYFIAGNSTDRLHQYTLATPWDLSTATYDSKSLLVSGQDTTPRSVNWKPDGTRVFMSGANNTIYQYN